MTCLTLAAKAIEREGLDEEVAGRGGLAEKGGMGHHVREVVARHAGEAEGGEDLREGGRERWREGGREGGALRRLSLSSLLPSRR